MCWSSTVTTSASLLIDVHGVGTFPETTHAKNGALGVDIAPRRPYKTSKDPASDDPNSETYPEIGRLFGGNTC